MHAFVYHSPTKILFGPGTEARAGGEIRALGGNRVLVLHTASAEKSGLLARVCGHLESAGLLCQTFGGILPNPRLSRAREAVSVGRKMNADFLLAIGGGSVIDTAKGVAHGLANPDVDLWDFFINRVPLTRSLPVGVILTIAAAGSETSASAVLTDEKNQRKQGFDSPHNRPCFAIMNPELTYTLPPFQLACGIVDILMHTMDRYFSPTSGNDLTDAFAEALLRTVIVNGRLAMETTAHPHAMSELMWCGSVSHTGLTGLGAAWDFAPHALARELGAMFDAPHGAALSTVWGAWAQYCCPAGTERFARFGREVWQLHGKDDTSVAQAAICQTVDYFRRLSMPTCLSELGVGIQREETLHALAHACCDQGRRTVGALRVLREEDLFAIYQRINR